MTRTFSWVIAWAQRLLGRLALDEGAITAAESHLAQGLATSSAGHFEVARTRLDLARLARARGDPAAVASHLSDARTMFRSLGLPRRVARREALALELGVVLA